MPEALSEARARPLHQQPGSVPTHIRLESLDDASYDISFSVFIAREYSSCQFCWGTNLG